VNRLVLASLNQGARLVGVLERRCRDHLLQRTDVQMAAAARAVGWFDFPDGDYGPHDYAEDLAEREAETEVGEPQAWPDELWKPDDPPRFCGSVAHDLGSTFVCSKEAGHAGRHESDGVTWAAPIVIDCLTDIDREDRWIDRFGYEWAWLPVSSCWGRRKDHLNFKIAGLINSAAYGPFTAVPESSAPAPRAVVAGASPGGATHPAPPGEREECSCFWVPESMWTTHYGAVEPGSQREWNPDCPEHGAGHPAIRAFNEFIRNHVDPGLHGHFFDNDNNAAERVRRLFAAALYPMQPRPETEAQK
jgi:hypothetical protein